MVGNNGEVLKICLKKISVFCSVEQELMAQITVI